MTRESNSTEQNPMSSVEQAWRAHVARYPGTRARRHSFDAGVAAGRAEAASAGRVEKPPCSVCGSTTDRAHDALKGEPQG